MKGQFAPNATSVDLSFAACFLEWSINFCAAAKIDLRIKKLNQEVDDLKLDLERGKLKLERFQRMKQDQE